MLGALDSVISIWGIAFIFYIAIDSSVAIRIIKPKTGNNYFDDEKI